MLKELMNHLGYGFFAETALVIFAVTFVAITVRTLRMERRESESCAAMALTDGPEQSPAQD